MTPEHHGRADGGMARKGELDRRREDANRGRVPLRLRAGDEHRLGEVELAGDGLHLVVEQAVGLQHHSQGIALEPLRGEHVE